MTDTFEISQGPAQGMLHLLNIKLPLAIVHECFGHVKDKNNTEIVERIIF